MFAFIQLTLSIDDQRTMIQKLDFDGNKIFKCASQNISFKIVSFVKGLAKEILSREQYKMLDDE